MAPPARVQLALAPTPILKLDRISRELGVELYLKRDDLTGLLESGSEVRKLEFLAGEALQQGADTLIAYGALQSDWCRAVSAVAARLGLRVLLAVAGETPSIPDGNLFLSRLLGADVRYLSAPEFAELEGVAEELAAEVRKSGRRPYILREAGASELAALGYLECAVEISQQIGHGAPRFDTVVVGAATGVSQAGLLMGKQLVGLPAQIVGVPVAWPAEQVRERILLTIGRAIRRFGLAIDLPKAIHLLDGVAGPAGAVADDEELRVIAHVARREGVLLGPAGSARAFAGLLNALRRDARALGRRVCFIHTGGLFSVFGHRESLGRLLDAGSLSA